MNARLQSVANPFFSVVIPAYNAAFSIAETLESVLLQSWRDFEVLVIDDGSTESTDQSPDIVRRISERDSRVRLISCPRRFGLPAGPRNIGIREATGHYIAFLDSDDIWKSEKLANDAAYLGADPVDFLYSGSEYFVTRRDNIVAVLDPPPMSKMILFRNLVMIQTVCVNRRLCVDRKYFFDEHPLLRGIEDYHFVLEAYLRKLRMARRPGSDVLYRKFSATSIYPRRNLPLLLYRHAWNLRSIRDKYSLPATTYYSFLALTMSYKTVQAILGRA
jgi:glycosyltransferase involved in cell wall biosynthesis